MDMIDPASPELMGLPEPQKCTCMFTRPGMRNAPPRSMTRAVAGACATAAGSIRTILPASTVTAMPRWGFMLSVPSRMVAFTNMVTLSLLAMGAPCLRGIVRTRLPIM